MSNTRRAVLWEHTWLQEYEVLPGRRLTRTVRVVGVWCSDKLEDLLVEERSVDGMGEPCWVGLFEQDMPERALAALLKQAGAIPAGEDISCV